MEEKTKPNKSKNTPDDEFFDVEMGSPKREHKVNSKDTVSALTSPLKTPKLAKLKGK